MKVEKVNWLEEQLLTTRNLCDIALLLKRFNQQHLLPTVLELLFIEVQNLTLDHCVKEESNEP